MPSRSAGLLRDRIEKKANLDYLAALLPINARCFIHITMVIFDTKDEAAGARRVRHLEAARAGRRPSRATANTGPTSTSWTSPRISTAFNDHAYRRFCETIKDALDPNGILMPGRHGIWPKSMRQGRGSSNGG